MQLSWRFWRRSRLKQIQQGALDDARAEALVQVEKLGMMGGIPPEMRLTPVTRMPRRSVKPLAIEHDE